LASFCALWPMSAVTPITTAIATGQPVEPGQQGTSCTAAPSDPESISLLS
jgi:hypothetical protein